MIGKAKVGARFRGLCQYLVGDRMRVSWVATRWLGSEDTEDVIHEMKATAALSSRCKKPVYHISLSWDTKDAPTRAQMEEACDELLGALGLSEHQAYLVAHKDTLHPHLHVMINRVHPETGKAWSTSHDYRRIEQTLRRLERRWGFREVDGHHALSLDTARPVRSKSYTTGEVQESMRRGSLPFVLLVRMTTGSDLDRSKSWEELASALKVHGLRMEVRPRGMVITDGHQYVAASRVAPRASRYQLERRYGQTLSSFLAGDAPPVVGRKGTRSVGRSIRSPSVARDIMDAPSPGHRDTSEEMQRQAIWLAQQTALLLAEKLFPRDAVLQEAYVEARTIDRVREMESALRAAAVWQKRRRDLRGVPESGDLLRRAARRMAGLSRAQVSRLTQELGLGHVVFRAARKARSVGHPGR